MSASMNNSLPTINTKNLFKVNLLQDEDITVGCELRSLSPVYTTFDEDFEYDSDDSVTTPKLAINEDALHGSSFQVWERCLNSVLSSITQNQIDTDLACLSLESSNTNI